MGGGWGGADVDSAAHISLIDAFTALLPHPMFRESRRRLISVPLIYFF